MTALRQALTPLLLLCVLASDASAAGLGQMCGGIAGIRCDGGLWCEPRAGMCRVADGSGSCVRPSQACTREYRPVCGCDNRTYGNDCDRRANRVAKQHDGAC